MTEHLNELDIRYSEACERNKQPIAKVLDEVLPREGRILEIGCGTGQHAVYFAETFAGLEWIPADRPGRLESIKARRQQTDVPNLAEPVALDLFDEDWEVGGVDALVAINVLHIAPWEATARLFAHADELLDDDGVIYIYGPFRDEDRELEPSNRKFDRMLKSRDPQMGLRLRQDVEEKAAEHGFRLIADEPMPANNRSLVWKRG
jgi:cyclopropane fatty-acyl-phospholipid synthase-like methyltransferase